jgi:hypothetical protein
MSSQEDYAAKLPEIQAIPDDQVKIHIMPVDAFLQEAENTYQWCQQDKTQLVAAGLDWNLVDDLRVRAGALREAQTLWFKVRFTREEADKEWLEKSVAAYDLRDQLLHDFRFAFRKQPDLMNRVGDVADGAGHADMIQDLYELASLGRDHIDLLQAISFDSTLLDTAALTADELADSLSRATTEREDNSAEKIIRDKAFAYLKLALDEIRACAQYVFWRDEERLKGYVSQYYKRRRSRKSAAEKTPAPAET